MSKYCEPKDWEDSVYATTKYGIVEGKAGRTHTFVWKGIPFAKPPVGDLRWKAPRAPEPWQGVKRARKFAGSALQTQALSGLNIVMGSEDCLYLNIWRPQTAEKGLPVYLYIHGGGNSVGAASYGNYHGAVAASTMNAVYVSVQYRLGPMGWFSHAALRENETSEDASGNYGVLDIIAALRWVKENIAAFGGNGEKITVAGESAGAMNIYALLVSPLAKGLFRGAILQSGIKKTYPMSDADAHGEKVLSKLLSKDGKADTLHQMSNAQIKEYLHSKTARQIYSVHEIWTMGILLFPVFFADGTVIPTDGFDSLAKGTCANPVPLMIGGNRDEWKMFMATEKKILPGNPRFERYARFDTLDMRMRGVDSIAHGFTDAGHTVYVNRFDWGARGLDGMSVLPKKQGERLGACHGLDITFFLGTGKPMIQLLVGRLFTKQNKAGREKLTVLILSYSKWFIHNGNPNHERLPNWPAWTNEPDKEKAIVLDADLNDLRISYLTDELTESGILELLNAELKEPERGDMLREMKGYADKV